ncbi:GNAT family N-acetyltransferase [Nocardioides flavescens]
MEPIADDLVRAWPPFGVRITCGPLEMRALRDGDFSEVFAVLREGVHAPERRVFYVPWTDSTGVQLEREFAQFHWRQRAEMSPERWALELGVWHEGSFVGMQGVSTSDFPVTRTGETGSWLGRRFHGRGIGTLMRQALCVACFDHLGFEEVTSGAFSDNPESLGVSRKVGYVRDGESRLVRDGAVATNVRLVLTPDALVRPSYAVEVEGAAAFLDLVGAGQARAT